MVLQQDNRFLNNTFEETNRKGLVNYCIYLFLLVIFVKIIYEFTFFDSTVSISLVITAILSLIIMIGVLSIFQYFNRRIRILWMLFVLSMLVSYINHFSGLEYICNTFTFLGLLTLLPYANLSIKYIRSVVILFTVYVLILFIFASRFEAGDNLIGINTNTSGIIICLFEIIILSFSKIYSKKAVMKYVCYFLAILSLIFQFQFASRSSLLGTGVLVIYLLCAKRMNKIKPLTFSRLVCILSIGSILFTYFYSIVLFNAIGHGNVFFMGKDIFTGRQTIWSNAFAQLQGHWIFGLGNLGVNNKTLHNQMLGYMYCFGILVTMAFIGLLTELTKNLTQQKSWYFPISIIIFLVISFFETLIYSSHNIAFISICVIVTFSCDRLFTEKERKWIK